MRQTVKFLVVLLAAVIIPALGVAEPHGGFGFRHGGFGGFHRPWGAPPPPPPQAWPQRPPPPPGGPWGWRAPQDMVRTEVRGGQMAPLSHVISNLQRRAPGRQLDTVVEFEDGRPVYRVRWLTNQGHRVDYVVDAATGRILGER